MQINKAPYQSETNKKQRYNERKATFTRSFVAFKQNTEPAADSTKVLEAQRAYYLSKVAGMNYKELQTFDVPCLGPGKVYQLNNGHKIIIIPKSGPTVISTVVNTGMYNDPNSQEGLSHLLEHLTAGYVTEPKDAKVSKRLAVNGIAGNAATGDFKTRYYLEAPVSNETELENLIQLQSEMLGNPYFDEQSIKKEKKVINAEENSRKDSWDLIALRQDLIKKNLFNIEPDKTTNSVDVISKQDLVNYYNSNYTPDNMITVIVGNVDFNTIKMVSKYFSGEKKSGNKKITGPVLNFDTPLNAAKRVDVRTPLVNSTEFSLSFIGNNKENSKEQTAVIALEEVLRNRFKDKKSLGYVAVLSGDVSPNKKDPTILTVGFDDDSKNEEKLKDIYSIIYDLTQKPITQAELEVAQNAIKNNVSFLTERSILTAGLYGDGEASDIEGEINSLTTTELQIAAKKYFDLNKASLVVIHPEKKLTKPEFNNRLDKDHLKEYDLPNNLRVVIDTNPGITRTSITMDLQTKDFANPKPGVPLFLSWMIFNQSLNKEAEKQGIELYEDSNLISLYSIVNCEPGKTLDAIKFLKSAVLNPDLSKENFDKGKEGLEVLKDKPISINTKFRNELFKNCYNNQSAYELSRNIDNITLEDLRNFYGQLMQNSQGQIVISMPEKEYKRMEKDIFNSLYDVPKLQKYEFATLFDKTKVTPIESSKVFLDTKDSDDTNQVRIKQYFKLEESGNIKDRAAIILLNQVLGGDDKSRLFKDLRNDNSMVYSVGSTYSKDYRTLKFGTLGLITEVTVDNDSNKDNMRMVLESFKRNIQDLKDKPISEDELNAAKASIKSELLQNLEASSGRNAFIDNGYNSFYGADYTNALLDAVNAVLPQDIQNAAKQYLSTSPLFFIEGKKETLEANKPYLISLGQIVDS